ncbi:MAG: ABC transporter permease [Acidobacteriota bacterium]
MRKSLTWLVALAAVAYLALWLFRPPALPFNQAETLVLVRSEGAGTASTVNRSCWTTLQERRDLFGKVEAWTENEGIVGAGTSAESVRLINVSVDFFDTLDVAPLLGRLFVEEDWQASRSRVAVLGHELWQQRFAGDLNVIGSSIPVNGTEAKVISVMPPGFQFPSRADRVDLILPLALAEADSGIAVSLIAKMRTDVAREREDFTALGESTCGPLEVVALTEAYFEA